MFRRTTMLPTGKKRFPPESTATLIGPVAAPSAPGNCVEFSGRALPDTVLMVYAWPDAAKDVRRANRTADRRRFAIIGYLPTRVKFAAISKTILPGGGITISAGTRTLTSFRPVGHTRNTVPVSGRSRTDRGKRRSLCARRRGTNWRQRSWRTGRAGRRCKGEYCARL
jgi:hypothetical protein